LGEEKKVAEKKEGDREANGDNKYKGKGEKKITMTHTKATITKENQE